MYIYTEKVAILLKEMAKGAIGKYISYQHKNKIG